MLKIQVIGHLGQDAVIKQFNGVDYLSFSVAHTEKYKDRNGVEHESTVWVSCLKRTFAPSPLVQFLKKGTKVYLEGKLGAKVYEANGTSQVSISCNISYMELLSSKPAEPQVHSNSASTDSFATSEEDKYQAEGDLPF